MESHEHKRQLEEIQARRIAYLEYRAKTAPSEDIRKFLQQHLDRIKKNNDRRD